MTAVVPPEDPPTYCTACGHPLEGAQFCTRCGTPATVATRRPDADKTTYRARPAGATPPQAPKPSRSLVVIVIATVLVVVGAVAAFAVVQRRGSEAPDVALGTAPAVTATVAPTASGASPSLTTAASSSTPTATTPALLTPQTALLLPIADAAQQMNATVLKDRPVVVDLAGRWVAQVSSKCPGLDVDLGPDFSPDGVTDTPNVNEAQILAFHIALAARFGAVLTTSADLGVSEVPDLCQQRTLWVSLVAGQFSSADDVLAWCERNRFPVGECAARHVAAPGEPAEPTVKRS